MENPITIIAGTNRPDANTLRVAHHYLERFDEIGTTARILSLGDLPADFTATALYGQMGQNTGFNRLQKMVDESDKFVFVVPEYNGSFPGVLKAFVDGLRFPGSFRGKMGALAGLAAGVQGGSNAIAHFNEVLNYLGMTTLGHRVKLSQINQHLADGRITNPIYLQAIEQQVQQLLALQSVPSPVA